MIIKGFGVFILIKSFDYLFFAAEVIIDFSQNPNEQFDLFLEGHTFMNILKFALYLFIGLISIFKSEKIKALLFKKEILDDDVIDQSKRHRYPINNFFLFVVRICGLIFVVIALSQIISGIFAAIFIRQTSHYSEGSLVFVLVGVLSRLILPICELICGLILIKTPNWLRRLMGLENL
ncbi:hypothetical protein [Brumimicrobium aurantiacum]|uniref:hypothetical protein n=1 Tax=Brumimicrobium aurantiacum TaxID=1737063 RepID=UPI000F4D9243|nr:hypothetical protein [Brumimicrobium aurantiacum]